MAKIIFYFHASENGDALIDQAKALSSQPPFDQLQYSLMVPRDNDLLAVPGERDFLAGIDLVMELVAPHGHPIQPLLGDIKEALAPLLALADSAQSYVLSAYHRTFQESGAKPIRYHYLMYRRDDYSRSDYLDYYTHHHYQFGVTTPLADYYQNYINPDTTQALASLFGLQAIEADNISELRFDDLEKYLFSDVIREVGPAATEDEEKFVNRPISWSFSMDVLLDTRQYG